MNHLWESLPPDFRFEDPTVLVTAWRGDRVGRAAIGITCTLESGNPEDVVIDAARQGTDKLLKLIDRHTGTSRNSPLVSVTTDLRIAQRFAGDPKSTIYEITIPAGRLMRDPLNTGTPGYPIDTEVFTVGAIQPEEITAVKVNNSDPDASELIFAVDGRHRKYDVFSDFRNRPAHTAPNPAGIWNNPAKTQ